MPLILHHNGTIYYAPKWLIWCFDVLNSASYVLLLGYWMLVLILNHAELSVLSMKGVVICVFYVAWIVFCELRVICNLFYYVNFPLLNLNFVFSDSYRVTRLFHSRHRRRNWCRSCSSWEFSWVSRETKVYVIDDGTSIKKKILWIINAESHLYFFGLKG